MGDNIKLVCSIPIGALGLWALTHAAPPQPVTNLQIQVLDPVTVGLSWSPVTQDTLGNPLPCVFYDLYLDQTPNFVPSPATWIDSTSATSYPHGILGGRGFYRVQVQTCPEENPLDLVTIAAGQFMMGQAGVAGPEHEVTLTRDFLLGRKEVTNLQFLEAAQWAVDHGYASVSFNILQAYGVYLLNMSSTYCEITFNNGLFGLRMAPGAWAWGFNNTNYDPAQHPVRVVSWYGAACYCDWMSLMSGLPAYYNGNWTQIPSPNNPYLATGYRLPTEAEWEFATQHDDERTYPWGTTAPTCVLTNHYQPSGVWCVGWSSPVGTHPGGASSLGLQDMAGNNAEWTNDWHAAYSGSAATDPRGPDSGSSRVFRGGSWFGSPDELRCANRTYQISSHMHPELGFRLCRTRP